MSGTIVDSHENSGAADVARLSMEDEQARMASIDMGPFLRQEGRITPRNTLAPNSRNRLIGNRSSPDSPIVIVARSRLRVIRPVQRDRSHSAPGITLWVSWLIRTIRRPE